MSPKTLQYLTGHRHRRDAEHLYSSGIGGCHRGNEEDGGFRESKD